MKIKYSILFCFFIALSIAPPAIAQENAPSLDRARYLIDLLEECSNDLKEFESELETLANLEILSQEEYNDAKNNLEIVKQCKENTQKELDELRADYADWFASSSSVMIINRERITPLFFQDSMFSVISLYGVITILYNGLPQPEH